MHADDVAGNIWQALPCWAPRPRASARSSPAAARSTRLCLPRWLACRPGSRIIENKHLNRVRSISYLQGEC